MICNPAFTQVIVVDGPHRTVYVGGQNAVDGDRNIVGVGDIGKQAEQVAWNLKTALASGGAGIDDVVKWTVYLVEGQQAGPAMAVFGQVFGVLEKPPTISVLTVRSLSHQDFLLEVDAVAVVAAGV
jgi:enamine deaminase RidA (YjgF/YER057c/UK114 family)